MTEWREVKLGEIGKIVGGATPNTTVNEYYGGNIPWLTPRDLSNYDKRYISQGERSITEAGLKSCSAQLLPTGSVLFSSRAPIGYVAIALNPIATNQGFKSIIPNDDVNNIFLYYLLKHNKEYIEMMGSGTTFKEVSGSVMRDIVVKIPPLEEQKKIADVLSALDDKIELLQKENETLETLAETIFRENFVENINNFVDGYLGDYIEDTIGGEWGKENVEGDFSFIVQCIRGTDIADLNIGLANKAPIRFVKEAKFKRIEPQNGDLILEISGGTEDQSTGRITYINSDVKELFDYPLVFSNFCRMLKIKKEEYSYFLYLYIKYLYDQDEFFNLENGSSGIKNLDYKSLLFDIKYPIPIQESDIINFNEKVSVYFEKINKNKLQIKTLITTRDTLLPKLMNQEIDIE